MVILTFNGIFFYFSEKIYVRIFLLRKGYKFIDQTRIEDEKFRKSNNSYFLYSTAKLIENNLIYYRNLQFA